MHELTILSASARVAASSLCRPITTIWWLWVCTPPSRVTATIDEICRRVHYSIRRVLLHLTTWSGQGTERYSEWVVEEIYEIFTNVHSRVGASARCGWVNIHNSATRSVVFRPPLISDYVVLYREFAEDTALRLWWCRVRRSCVLCAGYKQAILLEGQRVISSRRKRMKIKFSFKCLLIRNMNDKQRWEN